MSRHICRRAFYTTDTEFLISQYSRKTVTLNQKKNYAELNALHFTLISGTGLNILFCIYVHKCSLNSQCICKAKHIQYKTVCVRVYKGHMILGSCLISSPCNADILSRMQHVRLRRGECLLMTFPTPYDLPNKSHFSQSVHADWHVGKF